MPQLTLGCRRRSWPRTGTVRRRIGGRPGSPGCRHPRCGFCNERTISSQFRKTNAPSSMQPRNTLTVWSYSCPWFDRFFARSRPVRGNLWEGHTPAGPSLPAPPACSGAPVESLHVTLKKKENKKNQN